MTSSASCRCHGGGGYGEGVSVGVNSSEPGTQEPDSRVNRAAGGEVVPHTGFEPVISALRGRCPRPLDECGTPRRRVRVYQVPEDRANLGTTRFEDCASARTLSEGSGNGWLALSVNRASADTKSRLMCPGECRVRIRRRHEHCGSRTPRTREARSAGDVQRRAPSGNVAAPAAAAAAAAMAGRRSSSQPRMACATSGQVCSPITNPK